MHDLTRTGISDSSPEPEGLEPTVGPQSLPGFDLQDELGRGGMGIVYQAWDRSLSREVAVKILHERYSPQSVTGQRFLEEARITGQLQHPGIPAVYQVGTLTDGRPYLAMKLIRGQTLETLRKANSVPNPLAIFEHICQAVGYAHVHGVLHRDLKPANIMVGPFGEVQVMDWGLAKVLSATREVAAPVSDPAETLSTEARPLRESDGSMTLAGSVMGTPSYMPPEQAAGEIDKLTPRSDVFGLGAMLCVLLTGQPPYEGTTAEAVRLAAIRGETREAFARLDACGAEPEVVAVAKRCLAFDPANRPADARELAAEIARIRTATEDRARQAELDRATQQVQATEQRKRRRTLERAALAIIAALVVGVVLAVWQAIQARNQSEIANSAMRLSQVAQAAEATERAKADAAKQEAMLANQKAQGRLDFAVDAIEKVMLRVANDRWARRPELQEERREVLEQAVDLFQNLGEVDSRDPTVRRQTARAHLLLASVYLSLADYPRCRETLTVAHRLYAELTKEFSNELAPIRGQIETELMMGHIEAIAGQVDQSRQRYEQSLTLALTAAERFPKAVEIQTAQADCHMSLAMFFSFQRPDLSLKHHQSAEAIGRSLLKTLPNDFRPRMIILASLANVGAVDLNQGRITPAMTRLKEARELVVSMETMTPPTARMAETYSLTRVAVEVYWGLLQYRIGQKSTGIQLVRSGIESVTQLLKVYPKMFPLRINKLQFQLMLVNLLAQDKKPAEAEAVLSQLYRERDALLLEIPSAVWLKSFGALQQSQLLVNLAREGKSEAIQQADPNTHQDLDSLTRLHVKYNFACAYAQLAQFAPVVEREAHAQQAVRFLRELLAQDYFRVPTLSAHLDRDTDLDPLRSRPDYQAFRAEVRRKYSEPPEGAPTPRPVLHAAG